MSILRTSRIGEKVTSGWKCCTVSASLSAAAFAQKCRSRYFYRRKSERLSGLEGSQCNILPRKDAVPIRVAGNCPCLSAHRPRQGGQGTIGSLRRFFGDFLSLVKESYSSKTGQGRGVAGSYLRRSLPQSRLTPCQPPHQREPEKRIGDLVGPLSIDLAGWGNPSSVSCDDTFPPRGRQSGSESPRHLQSKCHPPFRQGG